ncbi:MAG: hypothetical protein ACLTDX_08905 [[Clostridium] innocuum]
MEDGSCVPPDEFIPLFEKHGMISSFDFYVLHKLCKLMRLVDGRRKTAFTGSPSINPVCI